jgi:DNA mismatch endonuclease (patch repair protein)
MSKVKGVKTGPEIIVRKFLHAKGLRYRLYNKKLPGTPDLTLAKYNTVIFGNGCFWHGHKGCKKSNLPKTKTEWWKEKIEKTIERDKISKRTLKKLGWNIIGIWECELATKKVKTTLDKLFAKVIKET